MKQHKNMSSAEKKFGKRHWSSALRQSRTHTPLFVWFRCVPYSLFPFWSLTVASYPRNQIEHFGGALYSAEGSAEDRGTAARLFIEELADKLEALHMRIGYEPEYAEALSRGMLMFVRDFEGGGIPSGVLYDAIADHILVRAEWLDKQGKQQTKLAKEFFSREGDDLDFSGYLSFIDSGMLRWEKRHPAPTGMIGWGEQMKRREQSAEVGTEDEA